MNQLCVRDKYYRRIDPKDLRVSESVEGAIMTTGICLELGLERLVGIWRTKDSLQELNEGKLRDECQNFEHLLASGDTNVRINSEEQLGSWRVFGVKLSLTISNPGGSLMSSQL